MVLEVEIPLLKVLKKKKIDESKREKNRYEHLTLIGEKCLVTFYHVLYPKRIAITYDKKV
jgi:hypothetical protein